MYKSEVKHCYSVDGEKFIGSFEDLKDAMADAMQCFYEDDEIHTKITFAKAVYPSNENFFPDADEILENIECAAYDIGGEFTEDYTDCSHEAKQDLDDRLKNLLANWFFENNIKPEFFKVEDEVEYHIVDGDFVKAVSE